MDNEALRRYTALASVYHTCVHRHPASLFNICIFQDDKWVRASEFEHQFLYPLTCEGPNLLPRLIAACQGDGVDLVFIDEPQCFLRFDEQGLEDVFRKARCSEGFFNNECGHWDVRRMLQHHDIACSNRRDSEAEYLPEGEVPRHDSQHDAERLEEDIALFCFGLYLFGFKEPLAA